MRVGILGPRGTHSEIAVKSHLGREIEIITYPTISDVVDSVERSYVSTGVIPVESMREGSVGEALDKLAESNVKIKAEVVMPISNSLLAVSGTRPEKIGKVLSHPQALSQCRDFLKKNLPKAELIETGSTARAAQIVSEYGNPNISKTKRAFWALVLGFPGRGRPYAAAIGPKDLAKIWGLKVLHYDIQTGEKNITRFLQIAKRDSRRTGHDKTSIVFYTVADKPGVLYEILGEFASRRINLTKIESRPSKKALGDYLFFIDLEGHREDEKVKDALKGIGEKTAMLKILGSYPKKF